MAFKNIQTLLASALAQSGTVTLSYPAGTAQNTFVGGNGQHKAIAGQNVYAAPKDFTLTFGASNITFTWLRALTLPVGTLLSVDAMLPGEPDKFDTNDIPSHLQKYELYRVSLGNPITADADGICASQSVSGAANATINGALASGGVATLDGRGGRNVLIASDSASDTSAKYVVVTGKDVNGVALSEKILFGGAATVAGKKAFATVSQIAVSAALVGAFTCGTGDVLGIPAFLGSTGLVLQELEDGAKATAGTLVAGVTTTPSQTTGDVRGTYDPNSACDGTKGFSLLMASSDPTFRGGPQNV